MGIPGIPRGLLAFRPWPAVGLGPRPELADLIGQLPHVTAIVISGAGLRFISEACAIARTLQPSIVVVEDVELAAEPRVPHAPLHPALLRLLSEMEGTGDDADVTFLLTTNRADLLEEVLAARPGQVDHTARLPLLLGSRPMRGSDAVIRPVLPHLRPTR